MGGEVRTATELTEVELQLARETALRQKAQDEVVQLQAELAKREGTSPTSTLLAQSATQAITPAVDALSDLKRQLEKQKAAAREAREEAVSFRVQLAQQEALNEKLKVEAVKACA